MALTITQAADLALETYSAKARLNYMGYSVDQIGWDFVSAVRDDRNKAAVKAAARYFRDGIGKPDLSVEEATAKLAAAVRRLYPGTPRNWEALSKLSKEGAKNVARLRAKPRSKNAHTDEKWKVSYRTIPTTMDPATETVWPWEDQHWVAEFYDERSHALRRYDELEDSGAISTIQLFEMDKRPDAQPGAMRLDREYPGVITPDPRTGRMPNPASSNAELVNKLKF